MGGMGSTRWGSHATKLTTGKCLCVDVRVLNRVGKLVPGVHQLAWANGSAMAMRINDDVTSAVFDFSQDALRYDVGAGVDYTACNYGGKRPWFVCRGCNRRQALLYVARGDVACRGCQNLLYNSQVESDADRAIRKAQTLGIRLGMGTNLVNGHLQSGYKRPAGMSQRTWDRLYTQYQNARIRAILMV